MDGEIQQMRSCISFAERVLEREMKLIKKMEEQGLNPYEEEEKQSPNRYSKKERVELTNKILEMIKSGATHKNASEHYGVPLGTYRKWRQRYNL